MNKKPGYIKIQTGKETGLAFIDEKELSEYCKKNDLTISNGSISIWKEILNNKGGEIGYITKPGYGITLKDPDYKWIIVWT